MSASRQVRLRLPTGPKTVQLNDDSFKNAGSLFAAVAEALGVSRVAISCGMPPRPLPDDPSAAIDVTFRDILVVTVVDGGSGGAAPVPAPAPAAPAKPVSQMTEEEMMQRAIELSSADAPGAPAPTAAPAAAAPARRVAPSGAARGILRIGSDIHTSPGWAATPPSRVRFVRWFMPSDNSCLYHALLCLFENLTPPAPGSRITQVRRALADYAQTFASMPEEAQPFPAVMLGADSFPDYARMVTRKDAWGGASEIALLQHAMENAAGTPIAIAVLSVSAGTVLVTPDAPPPGTPLAAVAWDGLHYDALLPVGDSDPLARYIDPATCAVRADTPPSVLAAAPRLVDAGGVAVRDAVRAVGAAMRSMGAFTDTAKFTLRCGVCRVGLVGEAGATDHARKTGHTSFQEYQ